MPPENNRQDSTPATRTSTYRERLCPWAIISLLPNKQMTILSRFRSRSDAEGHLQRLRQLKPEASLALVFDHKREEEVATTSLDSSGLLDSSELLDCSELKEASIQN